MHALPEDRQKPIELEADRATLDQRSGTGVYEGRVSIRQGSMELHADRLSVFLHNGEFQRAEARGKPATFRVQPSQERPPVQGRSDNVDYDVVRGLVVLTGNPVLTQGADRFSGERIEYDVGRDTVTARGGQTGDGRVRILLQPKDERTGR